MNDIDNNISMTFWKIPFNTKEDFNILKKYIMKLSNI
jgi:hypothetical protein